MKDEVKDLQIFLSTFFPLARGTNNGAAFSSRQQEPQKANSMAANINMLVNAYALLAGYSAVVLNDCLWDTKRSSADEIYSRN